MWEANESVESLDDTLPDSSTTLREVKGEEYLDNVVYDNMASDFVLSVIQNGVLTDKEETVLLRYYGFEGEEDSLRDLAQSLDMCTEGVRQVRLRAERKLKEAYGDELKTFIG